MDLQKALIDDTLVISLLRPSQRNSNTDNMSSSSPKKKGKRKKATPLPKYIRDELRMTCALHGYSAMKCGGGKKLVTQYDEMNTFYHGKEPTHPSQIRLLSSASSPYCLLFDQSTSIATKKRDDMASISQYALKQIVSLDASRTFYCGEDIRVDDLEKKNRTGSVLITGRHLHDMAKRGVRNYRKALSFCAAKYDLKTKAVKESGSTVADVIEYVRRRMYLHLHKKKDKDYKSDSETEDMSDDDDKLSTGAMDMEQSTNDCNTKHNTEENKNDTVNDDKAEQSKDIVAQTGDKYITDDDDEDVPDDYLFPSYFVFVTYGPFATPEDELNILKIDDEGGKNPDGSRAKHRAKLKDTKVLERENDDTAIRGFTASQRIDMENLKVQKQMMVDRQNETTIVALSVEESAISKQNYWQLKVELIVIVQCMMQRINTGFMLQNCLRGRMM